MTPTCAIDTETDGVHPGRHPWEVAMIRRDSRGEREVVFFVDIDLSTADPFGLEVGGFYERHPLGRSIANQALTRPTPMAGHMGTDYLTRDQAAFRIAQWTHGAHVIGAIPSFDTAASDPMLRAARLIPSWHYHLIDVEAMAVGWLAARDPHFDTSPPWNSDALARACGVEPPSEAERHTALGDARWALRWYDAITQRTAGATNEATS